MLTLVPAYGRDYKSQKAVKADWDAGKDFIIADMSSKWDGKPCNKLDFKSGESVMIRYKNKMNICVIKIK